MALIGGLTRKQAADTLTEHCRAIPCRGRDRSYIKVKGSWTYYYRAIDKSGANSVGVQNSNCLLVLNGWYWLIEVIQVKYLNNIIEQDHRFIKR